MRHRLVAAAAAAALVGTWVAVAATPAPEPSARAYLSYGFGAPPKSRTEPFHYGLRLDYDDGAQPLAHPERPALMQFDFDARGNRVAAAGGVPFAARFRGPLRQVEGDAGAAPAAAGGGEGGFSFFDWGLLLAGVGGIGFLVYEVTKGKSSPNPPAASTTGSSTGSSSGGLLGGTSTGGLLGGTLGGVLGGSTGGTTGLVSSSGEYRAGRLAGDGGSGEMGDLIPQH